MLKESLKYFNPQRDQFFIDCTLGAGGYSFAILDKVAPKGKVLSIDLDQNAIKNAKDKAKKSKFKDNLILVQDNFRNLSKIVEKYFKHKKVDGIIFDLGLSSDQLLDKSRGFSFKNIGSPLDMDFGNNRDDKTKFIINNYSERELVRILKEYGQERFARRIAKEIVFFRKREKIETVGQLVEIIKKSMPAKFRYGRIHFATRSFQALRIATNNELDNLELAIGQAINLLRKKGKIIVISYHSLEDRIVKHFFKEHQDLCKIITKKPIIPSDEEIAKNYSSRSAKMRVCKKI